MTATAAATMTRLDLTRRVSAHRTDAAVCARIGNAGFDQFAAHDRPQNSPRRGANNGCFHHIAGV